MKTLLLIFCWFAVCLLAWSQAQAQAYNLVVMTTSDSGPTYPTSGSDKNMHVVIGHSGTTVSTTVTLTITPAKAGDTVSVAKSSFNFNDDHIAWNDGSQPTGQGTGQEVARFKFLTDSIGNVNTISIPVANIVHYTNGVICSPTSGGNMTFYICVPKVTASRPTGDTTTNTFESAVFNDIVTISGCDNFNQIQWIQTLTDNQNYTDYSGTSHNVANYTSGTTDWPTNHSGWVSPGGTPGWSFSISGYTATLSPVDQHGDSSVSSTGTFQIGGTGTVYYYTELSSIACTFQDKLCRTGNQTNILTEYDWTYSWDNHNIAWPTSPNSPTMAQYMAAKPGNTSGVYGGTARSGSGATAGEWTNVTNITVP